MSNVNGKFQADIGAPLKPAKVRVASVSGASTDKRVVININESENPQDQNEVPVQINGRAYQIQRGKDVPVPPEVVVVLEHAVVDKAIPVEDANGIVKGFILRPSKRFPFRVVDEDSMKVLKEWKQASIDRRDAAIAAAEREAA